jgi:hypothetical protein
MVWYINPDFNGTQRCGGFNAVETVGPVHARSNTNTGQPQGETNKDYRFYDQLPKQQVTPIPDQAVPANQRQEAGVIVEAPAQPTAEISNASEPDHRTNQLYFAG